VIESTPPIGPKEACPTANTAATFVRARHRLPARAYGQLASSANSACHRRQRLRSAAANTSRDQATPDLASVGEHVGAARVDAEHMLLRPHWKKAEGNRPAEPGVRGIAHAAVHCFLRSRTCLQ
jgi:hypothetical protein